MTKKRFVSWFLRVEQPFGVFVIHLNMINLTNGAFSVVFLRSSVEAKVSKKSSRKNYALRTNKKASLQLFCIAH